MELPNIDENTTLPSRIEALRVYLEGMLGEDKFIRAYKAMDSLNEQAGTRDVHQSILNSTPVKSSTLPLASSHLNISKMLKLSLGGNWCTAQLKSGRFLPETTWKVTSMMLKLRRHGKRRWAPACRTTRRRWSVGCAR